MFRVSILWFRRMKSKNKHKMHNKIRGGVEFRTHSLLSLRKGKCMFRVSLLVLNNEIPKKSKIYQDSRKLEFRINSFLSLSKGN